MTTSKSSQRRSAKMTKSGGGGGGGGIETSTSAESNLTIWEMMFASSGHENDSPAVLSKHDDPIESHRKKKEAMYNNKNSNKKVNQVDESRSDENKRSTKGIWAKIRGRKSREGPEVDPTSSDKPNDTRVQPADSWSLPTTMAKNDMCQRSATYLQFGRDPIQQINVVETPGRIKPSGPDEVVVKVLASTITLRDCLIRRGLDYNVTDPVGLPAVSGSDFVGTVFLCGRNVTKFNPGDRVAGLLRSGGNARYTQVSQDALVRVPKRIDGGEAACMVSVYSTAYHAIAQATKDTDVRELKGKRVLVVGGMDGVGQAIIQMCRKAKANVFATAPDRRHAYVRSILKANPLPENSKDWSRSINGSMDYVFDGVFEGSMESSLRVLKDSGKCICFGTSSFLQEHMGWFGVPLHRRFERFQLEVHTNFEYVDLWDVYTRDREEYKANLKSLFELLAKKKIRPEIAKRVALDDVGLSHQKLEQGQVRGTVVCLPWRRVPRKNIQPRQQN